LITACDHKKLAGWIAEVEVKTDLRWGTEHSGAGLIYDASPSGDCFHAFVLQKNGRYAFLKKDKNGCQILHSGVSRAGQAYVFNSLAIQARSGQTVDLFINAEQVANVNKPSVAFQGGGVGLLAVCTGYFAFGSLRRQYPRRVRPLR